MSAARVLVVDDTPRIRTVLRELLELDGRFEVVGEAGNGEEAIVEAGRLRPDVVVLDMEMPILDGLEALPGVQEASPESLVVVFSTHPRGDIERTALAAGAHAYVEKGASLSALIEALVGGLAARKVTTFRAQTVTASRV